MTTVDFNEIDWSPTGNDALFSAGTGDATNDLLAVNPRDVRRAETAPMVLTILGADGTLCVAGLEDEAAPGEEYRYTQEYHELYYSKMPRDPRMLPPLTRRGRTTTTTTADADAPRNGAVGENVHRPPPQPARAGAFGGPTAFTTATATATAASHHSGGSSPANPSLQPPPKVYASKLREYVETFRPDWGYDKIRGDVFEFSGDQDGSRLVQRLIEKPENMPAMFEEVYAKFGEMAKDVFGNYVLQKLFESVPKAVNAARNDPSLPPEVAEAVLSANMMPRLVAKVRGHLKEYSMNTYGCRVMQKALSNMDESDRDEIIHEVEGCVTQCIFDQNANHVIQRIIEVCPGRCQFIVDAFIPELRELSYHAYGCRVLQCTFETCHDVPEVNIRPLLESVLSCINEFTLHQFGNYVVQHAMLNAPEDLRSRFVNTLSPSLYALSCSKFASNVAEKVICVANESEREKIIETLTKPLGETQGGNYLVMMMQDTYANYVVQRLLESASTAQRQRVGELVSPHVELINASVYGRHLLRKMEAMEVISAEFLRMKGIDVTTSDYNGASGNGRGNGNGGNRRGGNGGNANNRNNAVRNANANTGRSNNGNNNNNNNNNNGNRKNIGDSNNTSPQAMPMPGVLYTSGPTQFPRPAVMAAAHGGTAAYPYVGYVPMMNTAQAPPTATFSAMFPTGFPTPMTAAPGHFHPGYMSATSASVSPNQLSLSHNPGNANSKRLAPNSNNTTASAATNNRSNSGSTFRCSVEGNQDGGSQPASQQFFVNGGYAVQQPHPQQQQAPMMGGYFPQQPPMMGGYFVKQPQPQQQPQLQQQPQQQQQQPPMKQGNTASNNRGSFNNNNSGGGNNNNRQTANRKQGATTYVAPHRNGMEPQQGYTATDGTGGYEAATY